MFTGIVEQVGTVTTLQQTETGSRLVIAAEGLADIDEGASLAVNGVCLTAVVPQPGEVSLDLVPETLVRTSLGQLAEGDLVNLERAMGVAGRFDGHIVQGHVDGTGVVSAIDRSPDGGVSMEFETEETLAQYVVEKGSITVDGVSLTVTGVTEHHFSVALIPHTLEVTTLGLRKVGDVVNLETDVLAKYVERILRARE